MSSFNKDDNKNKNVTTIRPNTANNNKKSIKDIISST